MQFFHNNTKSLQKLKLKYINIVMVSSPEKQKSNSPYDHFVPWKENDARRVDLTHEPPFLAIDGPSARAIDDAIRIDRLQKGGFLIQVAIADCAVLGGDENTIHIERAINRKASLYTGKKTKKVISSKVIDKIGLTGAISDAMIIRQEIGDNGQRLKDIDIFPGKVPIRRLTYSTFGEACLRYNSPRAPTRNYTNFYRNFRSWCGLEDEPLAEIADTKGINSAGMRIVETSMFLANLAVAEWTQARDIPIIYREFSPYEHGQEAHRRPNYANYVANPLPFYGLPGFKNGVIYTHATSPLRRAADLINHLQIGHFMAKADMPFSKEDLRSISYDLSDRELPIAA